VDVFNCLPQLSIGCVTCQGPEASLPRFHSNMGETGVSVGTVVFLLGDSPASVPFSLVVWTRRNLGRDCYGIYSSCPHDL